MYYNVALAQNADDSAALDALVAGDKQRTVADAMAKAEANTRKGPSTTAVAAGVGVVALGAVLLMAASRKS